MGARRRVGCRGRRVVAGDGLVGGHEAHLLRLLVVGELLAELHPHRRPQRPGQHVGRQHLLGGLGGAAVLGGVGLHVGIAYRAADLGVDAHHLGPLAVREGDAVALQHLLGHHLGDGGDDGLHLVALEARARLDAVGQVVVRKVGSNHCLSVEAVASCHVARGCVLAATPFVLCHNVICFKLDVYVYCRFYPGFLVRNTRVFLVRNPGVSWVKTPGVSESKPRVRFIYSHRSLFRRARGLSDASECPDSPRSILSSPARWCRRWWFGSCPCP